MMRLMNSLHHRDSSRSSALGMTLIRKAIGVNDNKALVVICYLIGIESGLLEFESRFRKRI
jgi:hypothetical protein